MDITTIVGIIAGTLLVLLSILVGGGAGMFFNVPSLLITVGGTVASTLIIFPVSQIKDVVSVVRKAFFHSAREVPDIINTFVRCATVARREGILALENEIEEIDDPFLKKGIMLAVDGTSPENIQAILSTELSYLEERHKIGQGIFTALGTAAPAFGLIGTLIGLVQMLRAMDDPSSIGPSMAVALLTTLYGAIMANLIFIPIAGKLKNRTKEESLIKEITIEGILSIQSGDNPRVLQQKLMVFVSPKIRETMENKE